MKKENINCNNNTPSPALRASSPSRGEENDSCSLPPWRGKVAESRMRGWPSGFTLIELLVVVLIIGILAAIALPQYKKAVWKSHLSKLKPIAEAITQAQEVYYLANGFYATQFNELDVEFPAGGTTNEDDNEIFYTWGKCSISDPANTQCWYSQGDDNIRYLSYHFHNTGQMGKRICQATVDSFASQVCKLDTGDTSPKKWGETYAYFYN